VRLSRLPGVVIPSRPVSPLRFRVYALTWISYATYYLGRKSSGVTKARLKSELGLTTTELGDIDTAYLSAYAVGQFVNGYLGDRVGSRRLVAAGMTLSALAYAAFGLGAGLGMFLALMVANGLAQSTGWPGNTRAMAAWTTPENRGAIMGWWTTCYQVGGLVATALATWILHRSGWRAAFVGPALGLALVGALVFFALPDEPRDHNTNTESSGASPDEALLRRNEQLRVLRSVTVWSYGVSYFAVKLIRYSLLFWLPFYLHTSLHYAEERAGYLSTSFEIGGIAGAILFGLLTDRVRRLSRPAWSALSLVGLAGALLLYTRVGTDPVVNFAAMALVGALLFGPDTVISGCASQDLGGRYAAATAAGLVNGIGSLGPILQGRFTAHVSERYGWNTLFDCFVALSLLGALALVPGMITGVRDRAVRRD